MYNTSSLHDSAPATKLFSPNGRVHSHYSATLETSTAGPGHYFYSHTL